MRLFFALWPEQDVQARLARLAETLWRECGGRRVAAGNIHLTLAFLGSVPTARLADLLSLAETVVAPAFELCLDQCGYWRHNRIVWAGASHCPAALRALALKLAEKLRAADFRWDARDYVPHVTLLRDARRAPPAGVAVDIRWPAADFALVRSVQREGKGAYEVVKRWSFMPLV